MQLKNSYKEKIAIFSKKTYLTDIANDSGKQNLHKKTEPTSSTYLCVELWDRYRSSDIEKKCTFEEVNFEA